MHNITLKTLLNRMHPLKGFVYTEVKESEFVDEVIEVSIRPRKGSQGCCGQCGRVGPAYDHLAERRWRFIPVWGWPVFLVYALRRIDCVACGPTAERIPWATGKMRVANAFRLYLARWARLLSWSQVADCFGVGWADVYGSVKWVVDYGLKHRVLGAIQAIGVDEILVARGRRFWTLVYQIDAECRRLLWVGHDRTADTFARFFDQMGAEVCAGIRYVCSDMWGPYLAVVGQRLTGALHILDRFHIRKNQNQAVDEIRRQERRAMAEAGLDPLLKKMRWALLKRRQNWTPKERCRMRELEGSNLRSFRAFLLVEAFQHFWTYASPSWAGKFLDSWCRRVARSRLEPLKKVARSLKEHRQLLINYFIAKKEISGGVIEGLNNKVKLTLRKGYGFRTANAREVALFHVFGKLPEPELTHEFF